MGAGIEKGSGKSDFILSSLASGTVCATSSPPTRPLVSTDLHNCPLLHAVGLEEDSLESYGRPHVGDPQDQQTDTCLSWQN